MVPLPDFDIKTNNVINEVFVTISEIVDILKIINPNKASGPDKTSHKKLKIYHEKIVIPLQIIFNKSLRQCKYPSILKNAHVTAIFKKGDTSLPSNYRPKSLISCVGKVMERIIHKHVYNHLMQYKLIYQYQSGFLPKHSSVHQLIELYTIILNSLEEKRTIWLLCFL